MNASHYSPFTSINTEGLLCPGYLLRPHLEKVALQCGQALLEAHQREGRASNIRNVRCRVKPQLPPDVLGIYLYLPKK